MSSKEIEKKKNRILIDFNAIIDKKLSYILWCRHHQGIVNVLHTDQTMDYLRYRRLEVYEDPFEYSFGKDFSIIDSYDITRPGFPFVVTSMVRYISTAIKYPEIHVSVLCHNEYQEDLIKQMFNSNVKILSADFGKVNTANFTRIILGDIYDILQFTNPEFVDFGILNFRENFSKEDDFTLSLDILSKLDQTNSVTIIEAYKLVKGESI